MPVVVADSPLTCVALGAGQALDEIELLERTSTAATRAPSRRRR